MNNSLAPIGLVMLTVLSAVIWLHLSPTADPGMEGPRLMPGILRLPKDERKLVPSAELTKEAWSRTTSVTGTLGCPWGWEVVVVRAADRHPITASVVLGLAETLSRRGAVAVVAPDDEALLPLGAERVLLITSDKIGALSDASADATVQVTVQDRLLRLPDDHPAAQRQAALSGPAPTDTAMQPVTFQHLSSVASRASWSGRYAAIGRAIARGILDAYQCPATIHASVSFADWGSLMHLPPQYDGAQWFGAFQDDFVRGWVGEQVGTEAEAALTKRMTNGHWQAVDTTTPGLKLWSKDSDGLTVWFSRRGTELACWEERSGIATLAEGWLKDAADPTAGAKARAQLARYRDCQALPAELRSRMAAAVGTGH